MNAHSRKPANLSLDSALLSEAKALNVNISRAAERGLRMEVANVKAELWKAENATALRSSNSYVAKNGLPLDQYRKF